MKKLFAPTPCLQQWVVPLLYLVLYMLHIRCLDQCHSIVYIKTVDAAPCTSFCIMMITMPLCK